MASHFKRTGIIEILCDVGHVWMSAYVFVTDHPYVTVTDSDGAFELTNVPAGAYELETWHEGWKVIGQLDARGRPKYGPPVTVGKQVVVPAGGTVTVDFLLED